MKPQIKQSTLVLVTLLSLLFAPCLAKASPDFVPDDRLRPANSKLIEATVGIVLGYRLVANEYGISEHLIIWDDVVNKQVAFSLSLSNTMIDNVRFVCQGQATLNSTNLDFYAKKYGICGNLPSSITIGKTKVVVVYWRDIFPTTSFFPIDRNPATDQIFTVPDPTPAIP